MITCLIVTNLSLSDGVSNFLYRTAFGMVQTKTRRQRISGSDFEGILETEFRHGMLGAIGGIVFTAKLDTTRGEGKVTFLVRGRDLPPEDECSWSTTEGVFTPSMITYADYLQ